jgi:hypothetical protein
MSQKRTPLKSRFKDTVTQRFFFVICVKQSCHIIDFFIEVLFKDNVSIVIKKIHIAQANKGMRSKNMPNVRINTI